MCVLDGFLLTPWQHSQKHTAVIPIVYFRYCLIVNCYWKHLTATNSCLLETGMENVNNVIEKTQIIHFRDLSQVWQIMCFHCKDIIIWWWIADETKDHALFNIVLFSSEAVKGLTWIQFFNSIYLMTQQCLCGNRLSWGERLSVLSRWVGGVKFETVQQRAHHLQITMFTLYGEQTLHLAMWIRV